MGLNFIVDLPIFFIEILFLFIVLYECKYPTTVYVYFVF